MDIIHGLIWRISLDNGYPIIRKEALFSDTTTPRNQASSRLKFGSAAQNRHDFYAANRQSWYTQYSWPHHSGTMKLQQTIGMMRYNKCIINIPTCSHVPKWIQMLQLDKWGGRLQFYHVWPHYSKSIGSDPLILDRICNGQLIQISLLMDCVFPILAGMIPEQSSNQTSTKHHLSLITVQLYLHISPYLDV